MFFFCDKNYRKTLTKLYNNTANKSGLKGFREFQEHFKGSLGASGHFNQGVSVVSGCTKEDLEAFQEVNSECFHESFKVPKEEVTEDFWRFSWSVKERFRGFKGFKIVPGSFKRFQRGELLGAFQEVRGIFWNVQTILETGQRYLQP